MAQKADFSFDDDTGELLFDWVTVGDDRVCPDCVGLESDVMTLQGWVDTGGVPRVRATICNIQEPRCRCALVPNGVTQRRLQRQIEDLAEQGFNELVEAMTKGIGIDVAKGRQVILKDFKNIRGLTSVPYARIVLQENLIAAWKIKNNFAHLPPKYFEIADVELQIAWLEART